MNRRELIASAAATTITAAALPAFAKSGTYMSSSLPAAPVARKIPVRIEQLGRVRIDEYQWMKDDNWQAVLRDPTLLKPDVRDHLVAENAYREAVLASTQPLQDEMFLEMRARIKEDDSTVPSPDGPWEYYVRYRTGDQHPLYCRRERGSESTE